GWSSSSLLLGCSWLAGAAVDEPGNLGIRGRVAVPARPPTQVEGLEGIGDLLKPASRDRRRDGPAPAGDQFVCDLVQGVRTGSCLRPAALREVRRVHTADRELDCAV